MDWTMDWILDSILDWTAEPHVSELSKPSYHPASIIQSIVQSIIQFRLQSSPQSRFCTYPLYRELYSYYNNRIAYLTFDLISHQPIGYLTTSKPSDHFVWAMPFSNILPPNPYTRLACNDYGYKLYLSTCSLPVPVKNSSRSQWVNNNLKWVNTCINLQHGKQEFGEVISICQHIREEGGKRSNQGRERKG